VPRQLPAHPDQITAGWLTTALRSSGVLRSGSAASVRSDVIGADRGFTGVIARLKVVYAGLEPDERPPDSLVAKFPMAERAVPSVHSTRRRDDAVARAQFERGVREIQFYREAALAGRVPAPRLYFGGSEPAMRVVLLLEDVADAVPGDNLAGCSPAQARAVVNHLADLHAWGWQHPAPAWLPESTGDYDAFATRYAGYVGPFLALWGDRLPAPVTQIVRRLAGSLTAVLVELDAAPATIVHGDVHLDNIMFTGPDASRPVLLDWQGVRRGTGAVDVVAFVVGSLDVEARREHGDKIFADYLGVLAEHGVTGYSMEQLRRHAQLVLLRRVAGAIGWVLNANSGAVSPRERAMVDAQFGDGRLTSALVDYDVAERLPA
jgi:hypothetical protein